jgi:hypothetical protein
MMQNYTICFRRDNNLDYKCKHNNLFIQDMNLTNVNTDNDRIIDKFMFFTTCNENIKKINELDENVIEYNLRKRTFDFLCNNKNK